MTKIDIKESEGGGDGGGGGPAAEENKMSDKNREGVSNESGYFEDDDESGGGLNQEDSIEIIFDKNASNNNSGDSGQAGRQCRVLISIFPFRVTTDCDCREQFSITVALTAACTVVTFYWNKRYKLLHPSARIFSARNKERQIVR